MDIQTLGGAAVVAALATTAVQGLSQWLTKRLELRQSSPADHTTADAALVNAAAAFSQALGASWQKHTDELRNEIRAQADKVGHLEAEVASCHAQQAAKDETIASLRREVGEVREELSLMRLAQAVAPYPGPLVLPPA